MTIIKYFLRFYTKEDTIKQFLLYFSLILFLSLSISS